MPGTEPGRPLISLPHETTKFQNTRSTPSSRPRWGNAAEAKSIILESIERYNATPEAEKPHF